MYAYYILSLYQYFIKLDGFCRKYELYPFIWLFICPCIYISGYSSPCLSIYRYLLMRDVQEEAVNEILSNSGARQILSSLARTAINSQVCNQKYKISLHNTYRYILDSYLFYFINVWLCFDIKQQLSIQWICIIS